MKDIPLMPKATAVWLVENTSLSFKQIADFCNLHEVEIQGIADGEVDKGIKPYNPIIAGQLSREEIEISSKDVHRSWQLLKKELNKSTKERKKPKYTPLSKRQDRPDAILWLIKNYPELSYTQIARLIGTTRNTVVSIKDRTYWNFNNLSPKDPIAINLCSQLDLENTLEKAKRRIKKDEEKEKSSWNHSGQQILLIIIKFCSDTLKEFKWTKKIKSVNEINFWR